MRLSHSFPSFVAFLDPEKDFYYLTVEEHDVCSHEDCKDEFVKSIQKRAREDGSIAVWFASRGFLAPDSGKRPSRHPDRKRVMLVFESTSRGDQYWQAFMRGTDAKGNFLFGRWYLDRMTGGRFVNMLGRRPRLVKVGGGQSGAVQ